MSDIIYVLTTYCGDIDYEYENHYYFSSLQKLQEFVNSNTFMGCDEQAKVASIRLDTQEIVSRSFINLNADDPWNEKGEEYYRQLDELGKVAKKMLNHDYTLYDQSSSIARNYLIKLECDKLWEQHEVKEAELTNLSDEEISNIIHYRDRDLNYLLTHNRPTKL